MTTTASKSFTAVAVGTNLRMQAAELLTFNLSGTYAASLQVEEAEPSEMSWRRISPVYSTANATVAFTYKGKENMSYRWRCVAYTSGTAVTTAVDEDKILYERRDRFGNVLQTLKQSGAVLPGTLEVTGALTLDAGATANAPVLAGTTRTLTAADNGKTFLLDHASGSAVTLPAATGTGNKFRFVNDVTAPTTPFHKILTAPATDFFMGTLLGASNTAPAGDVWSADITASNEILLNGTTSGGLLQGDYIEVEDVASGFWAVRGVVTQSGVVITPFAHV